MKLLLEMRGQDVVATIVKGDQTESKMMSRDDLYRARFPLQVPLELLHEDENAQTYEDIGRTLVKVLRHGGWYTMGVQFDDPMDFEPHNLEVKAVRVPIWLAPEPVGRARDAFALDFVKPMVAALAEKVKMEKRG